MKNPTAITLARLRKQPRKERHDAISAYAEEFGGTSVDLDPELEAAGIEHLVKLRGKSAVDLD